MAAPPVTVLMSVKNGQPWIGEAVRSVLDQTLSAFRFLILDNASTDETVETIRSLGDPRIDLHPQSEDLGQTGALNKGLSMVESPYVARMDADDVCLPRRLELQAAFLDHNPETALVGSAIETIDEQGKPLGVTRFPTLHQDILDHLPLGNQFAHSAAMYRHGPAMEAGGYDGSYAYAQDLALWMSLLEAGHETANLEPVLVRVRSHESQATRDARLRDVRLGDNLRLAERMAALPSMSARARQAARMRAAFMLWGLDRKGEAMVRAVRTLALSVGTCLANPLIWKGVRSRIGS